MAPSFTADAPVFPQELVDHIVDDVACQTEALDTLRICSILSRSFRSRSRQHIFSQIDFTVSHSAGRKQVTRLMNILQLNNAELLPLVRSLKLVFAPASSVRGEITSLVSTLLEMSGLKEDAWCKLVDALKCSKLESLTFASPEAPDGEHPSWTNVIDPALFQICSDHGSSLKSLCFANIVNVPASLIIESLSSNHLLNLELSNVLLRPSWNDILKLLKQTYQAHQHVKPIVSKINRLAIRRMSYFWFGLSLCLSRVTLSYSGSLFACLKLPQLRILVVSIPENFEDRELRDLILSVSPSLESLELEYFEPISKFLPTGIVLLNRLTSLRRLKFTGRTYDANTCDLNSRLCLLNDVIASATSPVGIESIDICFSIQSQRWDAWKSASGWARLDNLLVSEAFSQLRDVHLSVEVSYSDPAEYSVADASGIDAQTILPTTCTCPSITFSSQFRVQ